jgi:hypothetical protein
MNWKEDGPGLFVRDASRYSSVCRRSAVAVPPLVPSSPLCSVALGSASLSLVLRARLKVFVFVRPILRRHFDDPVPNRFLRRTL